MEISAGKKVKLTKTIFDGGECCPTYVCGKKGDVVIVKEVMPNGRLAVHHADITDGRTFIVFAGEYFETLFQDLPASNAYS